MLQLMATAPVSDMNRRARDVLAMLEEGPVALLQRSEPAAIMVSPVEWNKIAAELEELEERVLTIQNTTAGLLRRSEDALVAAIDAIVAAQAAGATDEQLAEARQLHRASSLRWDFVSSENSTGFHSPQEAARLLGESIDMARQAELKATQLTNDLSAPQARAN